MERGYLDVCPDMVVQKTSTMLERARGLIGRDILPRGSGLWIQPCSSVHTFFMSFAIDVIFLNRQGYIKKIIHELSPNRIALSFGAAVALELRSGEARQLAFEEGQRIQWLSSEVD